jgi:hypothetical protein
VGRGAAGCHAVKSYVGAILEAILAHLGHTTRREQALVLELVKVKDQLAATTTNAEAAAARADAARNVAEERLALLTASAALAEERAALLTAAASRAENAETQLRLERRERELVAKHMVRLELRVQALKRRRERLQADLCKFQDQLARADVSGSIRELQKEKVRLQQRVADLETYFAVRIEPPHAAANLAQENQGSANPR